MRAVLVAIALLACGPKTAIKKPLPAGIKIQRSPSGTGRVVPVELPFGQDQNGGLVLLALLRHAETAGAVSISDLQVHLVFKRFGVPIECTQRVLVGDEVEVIDPSDFDTKTVSFTATEQELTCTQVPHAVDTIKPEHASKYDATAGRLRDKVPEDRTVAFVYLDRCELRPVTRAVTRYDYQVKLGFVPPSWDYFAARYADARLRESQPICKTIDPDVTPLVHRLTARIGFPHQAMRMMPDQLKR
jgi:hypothetical protein